MQEKIELDVFIEGETIDLCVPTYEFAEKSDWYKWFNHPFVTKFLHHGVFPNTKEKQIEFFTKAMEERLLLIITNKQKIPIGSTSLLGIDYKTRTAGSGTVIGNFLGINPLEALEAVARMTEHAFLKIGLERIIASQHIKLIPWSHRMSLIGYRLEGIFKNDFIKGMHKADGIKIAAHYEDYQKIIATRGGGYGILKKKCLSGSKNSPKNQFTKSFKNFSRIIRAIMIASSNPKSTLEKIQTFSLAGRSLQDRMLQRSQNSRKSNRWAGIANNLCNASIL